MEVQDTDKDVSKQIIRLVNGSQADEARQLFVDLEPIRRMAVWTLLTSLKNQDFVKQLHVVLGKLAVEAFKQLK